MSSQIMTESPFKFVIVCTSISSSVNIYEGSFIWFQTSSLLILSVRGSSLSSKTEDFLCSFDTWIPSFWLIVFQIEIASFDKIGSELRYYTDYELKTDKPGVEFNEGTMTDSSSQSFFFFIKIQFEPLIMTLPLLFFLWRVGSSSLLGSRSSISKGTFGFHLSKTVWFVLSYSISFRLDFEDKRFSTLLWAIDSSSDLVKLSRDDEAT